MDQNKYENMSKLRLKVKLDNDFVLDNNLIKNIELGISFNDIENENDNNTNVNEYSLNN